MNGEQYTLGKIVEETIKNIKMNGEQYTLGKIVEETIINSMIDFYDLK